MRTTQDKLNTAIVQYKRSIQVLLILPHGVLFTILFPTFVFNVIACTLIIIIFWMWCDLIYYIEESNRNQILGLIDTCTNDQTKDILCYELYLHDQNSIFGDPLIR
jgi:hypothetical protein